MVRRLLGPGHLCDQLVFVQKKKKTVLESLKDFLQNVQHIFSIFFFVFY